MQSLEEMEITHYMVLDQQIKSLHHRKRYKRWEFYQQSFYTATAYTELGVITQAVRTEKAVERLEIMLAVIDSHICILNLKKKYWQQFLSGLTAEEQSYFKKKYVLGYVTNNERLDQLAIEEIQEIIVAISFQLGIRDEDTDQEPLVENDFMGNLDLLLERVEA